MAYAPEDEEDEAETPEAPITRGTRIATRTDRLAPDTPEVAEPIQPEAGDTSMPDDINATSLGNQSIRYAEADKRANEAAKQAQLARNPFLFSNAIKPASRRDIIESRRAADVSAQDELQEYRRQQVEARKQAMAQQRAANFARTEDFRSKGMLYRVDANGIPQPIVEASSGRQLYKPVPWAPAKHPKDGRPVKMMIDKFGQPQYKDYPLVESTDPLEGRFYYDIGDGESFPAMSYEDAAASKDIGLSSKGKLALQRKAKAERDEAIGAMETLADSVNLDFNTAVQQRDAIKSRIEALSMGGGDPKELEQLATQQADLDAQLNPQNGALALRKHMADRALATEKIRSRYESYRAQGERIAERLKQQGIDPATDPSYQENAKALAAFEAGLKTAQSREQEIERLIQPVPQAQPAQAPVASPSTVAEASKSFARGATSEGLYAAAQGMATLFGESPIRRALEAAEDWATEKIQGFPLTEQQKATRQKLRQRAEEKTGIATVDRFAKDYAKATGQLRDEIRRALPVDEKFAQSLTGQISQGLGQLAGTAPMAAFGAPGIAAASLGQIYDEAYQDAKQSGQDDATAHATAMKYLPAAGLDFLADRMVIGKLLKPLQGKMTVGQLLKDVLATAAAEGSTEGGQQLYLNAIAKNLQGYDPNRPIDKDVIDSAIVGAVVGGTASGVGRGGRMALERGETPEGGNVQTPEQPQAVAPAQAEQDTKEDDSAASRIIYYASEGSSDPERALSLDDLELEISLLESKLEKKGKLTLDDLERVRNPLGVGESAVLNDLANGDTAKTARKLSALRRAIDRKIKAAPAGTPAATPSQNFPTADLTAQQQAQADLEKAMAETERIERGAPLSAKEAAEVFEPALKEKANVPPPFKSAEESASAFEEAYNKAQTEEHREALKEARIQRLIDELSSGNDSIRSEIIKRRKGLSTNDFLKVLDETASFRRNPERYPDILRTEINREIENSEKNKTQRSINEFREAEASPAREAKRELARSENEQAQERYDLLRERRDAIDDLLTSAERLRQSPEGAARLREQLAAEATQTPLQEAAPVPAGGVQETAPEPVAAPATVGEVAPINTPEAQPEVGATIPRKPLPEGTQFLYEQNGTRYYQMPDAEAARGSRTVDEATLQNEGYDVSALPQGERVATDDEAAIEAAAAAQQSTQPAPETAQTPEEPKAPSFQPGVAPVVSEMIQIGRQSASELRKRISGVKYGPIENGKETIIFNLDGKPMKGVLTGRNRNLVLSGDARDAAIATRVLLDEEASPLTTEEPTNALRQQPAAQILQRQPNGPVETRRGRGRVEQGQQGEAPAREGEAPQAVREEVRFENGGRVELSGGNKFNDDVSGIIYQVHNNGKVLDVIRDGTDYPIRIVVDNYKTHKYVPLEQRGQIPIEGKPSAVATPPPATTGLTLEQAKAHLEEANKNRPLGRSWDEIEAAQGGKLNRTLESIREARAKMAPAAETAAEPKAPQTVQEEIKPRDYDAQETASGTTYQYKLVKEGDMWTAKTRMVRPDGTVTEWDGPIGIGRARDRAKVAERFAERFPDAAKESEDADIKSGFDRIQERKATEQAKQEKAANEQRAQRETLNAYREAVANTPLPKGQNKEIKIAFRNKEGEETSGKVVPAVVYGDWAIYKNENQYDKQNKYLVAHVPSGLKARGTENLANAKKLVQSFILSGVDASKEGMKSDNASLKKLSQAIQGIYGEQVPEWFKESKKSEVAPQKESVALESSSEPTPVSQMSRDALRAELKAAGIETVKDGTPIDEAAPNQLMAAVGRLRYGEGNKSRTSDRIIETLQKAKFQKPGQVMAHTPFTLAYDGAIDMAILAIRAGRAVKDAIELAMRRFRAVHPKATEQEIAKARAGIEAAISQPPEPPKPAEKKESKVSQSYAKAGVPVEPLEYDVRNQEERVQEAAAIIKKDGVEAAETKIEDKNLPRDTRVAIGGELINRKMLDLANAKPEDAGRITRDIRRIAAKMRPELATESGQSVAMFNRIYQDAAVAAGHFYSLRAQKEQLNKLGGEETEKAADEAKEIITNRKLTPEQKAAEIEKLKKRYSSKPTVRVLNELKRIEVLKKLNDLGALTRDDLIDTAANALGIPGIDPKKLKHLAEIADKIKAAKNHAEKSRAELELADALHIYKGVKIADLETSILTLNILSGFTTQMRNIGGNAMQALGNLSATAISNPKQVKPLIDGLIDGFGLGMEQAKSIMQTGRGTRDFQAKTHFEMGTDEEGPLRAKAQSPLATVDYTRDFGVNPKLGKVLTARARAIEQISRFMKAADAVFYYSAREAYARMMATKILEGQYSGAELDNKVREMLNVRPEDFKAARDQAAREGYDGVDMGRRVADILEDKRRSTKEGSTIAEQSEQFGSETTFTNEPVGMAGVFYRHLNRMVQEGRLKNIPVLKPFMMFLRTPTNVFNSTLNYTPIGAMRATYGMKGETPGTRKNFNKEERARLYVQALIGSAIMGGLLSALSDDDEGEIGITAKGPSDFNKRKQLSDGGWKPYSIKVGGKYISYRDSPLLVPLSFVGNVVDSIKYKKSKDNLILGSQMADAILSAPQVIFETSMLSSLGDLMSALSGTKQFGPTVGKTLGSIPANLVIPYNRLVQQMDQTFEPTQYKTNQLQQNVPFARRLGEKRTDIQGRTETYTPIEAFGTTESKDPVDKLLREKDVFIPDVARNVKLGKREMTDTEREQYRRLSGQRIRARILPQVQRLNLLPPERVEKEIDSIVREERDRVKERIRTLSLAQPAAAR